MYRNHTVGVVVPAYDEEEFVADVVHSLPDFVDAVYLVDDASTDGTWRAMGEATRAQSDGGVTAPTTVSSAEFDRTFDDRVSDAETVGKVTRLRHRENRGAGGAVKTGYLAALEDGVDVVATVDGDGQMDSERLPAVLDPVVTGRAEYAKGNRFASQDVLREMPPFRLFGNVLLTGLTRIASGYWQLSDPQNGFTAISRRALTEVDPDGIREYYGYMNHLMARLNVAGVRIADVSMPVTYGDEESSIDYRTYVCRVSLLLLVSFFQRIRTKYFGRRRYFVFVGYVAAALLGVVSGVGWILSAVTGRERRVLGVAVRGVALGSISFLVAAVLDRAAEPVVVAEREAPTRKRVEAIDGE